MKFIFYMQINIEYNHFGECNQACPKYPSLHIFALSPLNNGEGGVKLSFCLQINTKVFYNMVYQYHGVPV